MSGEAGIYSLENTKQQSYLKYSKSLMSISVASTYTLRVSMARFAHGLPTPGRAAHGLLIKSGPDSMLQWI